MLRRIFYIFSSFFSNIFKLFYANRLRVLAYHDIPDAQNFGKHINYLKANYSIISPLELFEFLEKKSHKLPKNSLIITFDDGDPSLVKNGLPILRRHKIPAIVFIITGYINGKESFWNKNVFLHELNSGKSIGEAKKRVKLLKELDNEIRLLEINGIPPYHQPQITNEDLSNLEKSNILVANHSHTHPMFDKCSAAEITQELENSRKFFEDIEIGNFETFAYPNGNWNQTSNTLIQNAGIKFAFLFDHRINSKKIDPLKISRIRTNANMTIHELKAKVSGLHPLIMHLKN